MNEIARTKDTITTLKAAQKLIGTHEKWCKGSFARDIIGDKIGYNSPDACQWCSLGAIRKSAIGQIFHIEEYLENAMYNKRIDQFYGTDFIVKGNDSRTTEHLHVMMAYDFAILMAQDDLKAAMKATKKELK